MHNQSLQLLRVLLLSLRAERQRVPHHLLRRPGGSPGHPPLPLQSPARTQTGQPTLPTPLAGETGPGGGPGSETTPG